MKTKTWLGPIALSIVLACLATPSLARELSFEDRVRAQIAIERVYYAHQIGVKQPFEEAVPRAVLERKVRTYLAQSAALASMWHTPVTAAMLRGEIERIVRGSRMPETLRELYGALGGDGFVVEECLARATLVDRLTRSFFATDVRIDAEVRLRETGWDEWWKDVAPALSRIPVAAVSAGADLPGLTEAHGGSRSAAGGFWDNGALNTPPTTRYGAMVWTGSVMVVWGGQEDADRQDFVNTGLRYDPATDVWTTTSIVGAPEARSGHAHVWTGNEVIVWGGNDNRGGLLNTGGRYDPLTDTWQPTSTAGAPRSGYASAVWTGSELVVWGGTDGGGRYDPSTDTWRSISKENAPQMRTGHVTVWTGSEMIVWGGYADFAELDTGGRYDPVTDSWKDTSVAGAPSPRGNAAAVWTANEMIVWGGDRSHLGTELDDGARYDPRTDSWSPLTKVGAPGARTWHQAVWTGTEMVVWGGAHWGRFLSGGGRYDAASDRWTPMSELNAPSARYAREAIWTGTTMIVWGGQDENYRCINTGGRYDPATDSWTPTSTGTAPRARYFHSAVWTGTQMIVWGGGPIYQWSWYGGPFVRTGDRYDAVTDRWTPVSTAGGPSPRSNHTAVWTGDHMIVWGGYQLDGYTSVYLRTGGRYDPIAEEWTPTSLAGAPDARVNHSAVWTGTEMIVWGGEGGLGMNSGGRYDPVADRWTATSITGAPEARANHTATWTGKEMIVWGGQVETDSDAFKSGGRYDPATDSWEPTSLVDAPRERANHTAVWTGHELIVWGGSHGPHYSRDGAIYDPETDRWRPMAQLTGAAMARQWHRAVWTGTEMIVWGGRGVNRAGNGDDDSDPLHTGARYDLTDHWTALPNDGAPVARDGHTIVWTGDSAIVWGGGWTNTGGRYVP